MKFEQRDVNIINRVLRDHGPMNEYELREFIEELMEDEKVSSFWEKVHDCLCDVSSLKLLDVKDRDGFQCIYEIMETLHYDNGEPLICDEYNYFDFYDRDQDYWGFFGDIEIDHFELEDGELVEVVKLTYRQLRSILTRFYDGSSWEHDFGDEDEED